MWKSQLITGDKTFAPSANITWDIEYTKENAICGLSFDWAVCRSMRLLSIFLRCWFLDASICAKRSRECQASLMPIPFFKSVNRVIWFSVLNLCHVYHTGPSASSSAWKVQPFHFSLSGEVRKELSSEPGLASAMAGRPVTHTLLTTSPTCRSGENRTGGTRHVISYVI